VDGATKTIRPSAIATGVVEWARRMPDRAAVIDVRHALTLGELDAAAAALAARLLDGGGSTDRTDPPWLPIVLDRSVPSVVAVHGAIRAGLPFARIESTTPRDVVAEMFTRLGNPRRAVVADPDFAHVLPKGVEAISTSGHERAGAAPPQVVDHHAPGRVQFTSGSTGRPKGVVSPWSRLDENHENVTTVGPSPEIRQWTEGFVHQFGAGATFRAIALPSAGRTTCIGDPSAMSIDELLDWFAANHIDTVAFPPSLSYSILRVVDGRPRLPSVSVIRSNSDSGDWSIVAPLRRLVGPHLTVRPGYAASEAGTIARFDIGPDDPIGEGRIPLGRLLPGVEVRLEPIDGDPSMTQLLVARPPTFGYLDDPELTASRYITDEDGTRWWRSRDLVRVDDSGMYHHLGRADEMVKVKGSFVAPSRVEQALESIDGIGAAAAVLHRGTNDSVRIVAHVQVVDHELTPGRVDAEMKKRLSPELLPAIIVRHDELPRTQRMKIDRSALEHQPLVRWRSTRARSPRSEFEWWCVAEARRIIGLDDLTPDDDLFGAGLDSLGALELGAALADAGFGEFDPPRLFEARTVEGIERMVTQTRDPDRSAVVVLNAGGTRPPLFALPGGGGNALEYRFLADALGPDQPVAVVEIRGMHSPDPPDRTIDARATHVCDEIEARLGADDPLMILAYSGGGPGAYESAQRVHATGRPVHLVLIDTAPTTKGRQRKQRSDPTGAVDRGTEPPTVRTASVKDLPGAVLRSARFRLRKRTMDFRVKRLIRDPGSPSFERLRYRAFRRIQSAWNDAYDPAPAAFPATLVTVEGSDALRRCGELMPDLVVRSIGGNHQTLLLPPHVEDVATIVAAAAHEEETAARGRREKSATAG
jgi:acyl-coenzyme A synthetase/AMP-(fatty) acid ligase/thioesterase domain-containing protein